MQKAKQNYFLKHEDQKVEFPCIHSKEDFNIS